MPVCGLGEFIRFSDSTRTPLFFTCEDALGDLHCVVKFGKAVGLLRKIRRSVPVWC